MERGNPYPKIFLMANGAAASVETATGKTLEAVPCLLLPCLFHFPMTFARKSHARHTCS